MHQVLVLQLLHLPEIQPLKDSWWIVIWVKVKYLSENKVLV
jgi:hypothetical protein